MTAIPEFSKLFIRVKRLALILNGTFRTCTCNQRFIGMARFKGVAKELRVRNSGRRTLRNSQPVCEMLVNKKILREKECSNYRLYVYRL